MLPPLGTIGQVAFVTSDLRQSMWHFARVLGIGPWFFEPRLSFKEATYCGRATGMEIAAGIANNGAMQFELIEQLDREPSVYLDLLDRDPLHESFHHLCLWADDYPGKLRDAEARGYGLIQTMISGLGAAAYLTHPLTPHIALEVVEANARRKQLRANVAAAAAGWDGRDPIREGFPIAL